MDPCTVIGLAGRAGSGKSTAAKYLEKAYGAKRMAFATPIKEMARAIFRFHEEQLNGTQAQKEAVDAGYGFSAREALVRLGAAARDNIGPGVWVDAAFYAIQRDGASGLYVIEDVRYPREAERIARTGGKIIKLVNAYSPSNVQADSMGEADVDLIPALFINEVMARTTEPKDVMYARLDGLMARWGFDKVNSCL